MNTRPLLVLCAAVVLSGGGCELYRIETVLHPDGRVERAVCQPADATPKAAADPSLWKVVTHAPKPKSPGANVARITDFPPGLEKNGDRPYFVAWGSFASPEKVPAHVVIGEHGPQAPAAGRLERTHERVDYVLVTEHRWTERLTDTVTFDDMRKAREELADLLIGVGRDVFAEMFGNEYDATELVKWLRADGKTWLNDSTDFHYLHSLSNKGKAAQAPLEAGLTRLAARRGLDLRPGGKELDDEQKGRVVQAFLFDRLTRGIVRKKDGKPLDPKTAALWVKVLVGEEPEKHKAEADALRDACARVVEAKYGGEGPFRQKGIDLFRRVFGVHQALIFDNDTRFDCTITMPGDVVETNGTFLGGNRVRWRFEGTDAFPLGFDMTARALAIDGVHGIPGAKAPVGRDAMIRFRDLVTEHDWLLDALKACRAEKSVEPLHKVQAKDPTATDELMKLVGLVTKP